MRLWLSLLFLALSRPQNVSTRLQAQSQETQFAHAPSSRPSHCLRTAAFARIDSKRNIDLGGELCARAHTHRGSCARIGSTKAHLTTIAIMGELVPIASTSGALIAKQNDPETALVQYEKRLKEVGVALSWETQVFLSLLVAAGVVLSRVLCAARWATHTSDAAAGRRRPETNPGLSHARQKNNPQRPPSWRRSCASSTRSCRRASTTCRAARKAPAAATSTTIA